MVDALVVETISDWVWVAWDFVYGSVRQTGCSLDCIREREPGLVLLWALVWLLGCVGPLLCWAPISVKGSRHF